ncbi:hypothetical protein DEO48_26440 [Enterobacter sp. CGMCC 5087]|uniref:hypothetical protein n=1 Tax=Enterobacter sp. CGMCC 5087 TaxID=2183878 RepID=UPI000D67913E|nr:hypothetical protein [Enterobacter sp. CGMCC 5087]PWI77049.1 hypothetical protein DEO48_26440 [Enterobacter sp. CGMCC 5087]
MADETKSLEINTSWVSLTDGTQTATLQVFHDSIRVVSSAAEPAADDTGFILEPGLWKITPPTAAWIRAQNASSRIVYTLL